MNDLTVTFPRRLTAGWAETKLSEIGDINPTLEISHLSPDLPVSFVPMQAVSALTGQIDTSNCRPLGEVTKGYTRFTEGDVLFAKITPCMENGKIAIASSLSNGLGFGSTEFHVIRSLNGILNRYIFYYLLQSSFREVAEHNMKGTAGQRRVPAHFLSDASIPIPPSREQERIVAKVDELFSELDAGVASLKRAKELLKKYRQAVLKAAVTGELTRDWRERHQDEIKESGAELLQRILKARRAAWEAAELKKMRAKGKRPNDDRWKQKYQEPQPPDTTGLPALPEGWVWVSLDQLSWDSCYGTSSKCDYAFGGVPVLRIPNVRDGYFSLEHLKNASVDLRFESQEFLEQGDMLIIRTNGSLDLLGQASVLTQKIGMPTYFASYLIRFRLVEESTLWRWVNVYWQDCEIRRWLERNAATSAGQYNISQSRLSQAAIALPPLDEADAILESVEQSLSGADRLARDVELAEKESSAFRQAMLKAAFAGKLVPQDPNDEPASVLLARIRAERAARPRPTRGRRTSGRSKFREDQLGLAFDRGDTA